MDKYLRMKQYALRLAMDTRAGARDAFGRSDDDMIRAMAHDLAEATSSPTSELALIHHGRAWYSGEYRDEPTGDKP